MLSRFRSDQRGVAAVEFALLAPAMVLLYCGLAELSLGFLAERRAAHAAAVIADLVAAPAQMTPAQVDDTINVGDMIMRPFPTSELKVRVTNVTADAQGSPKVVWSRGRGLTPLATGSSPAPIQAGLLNPNQTVILAEVSYEYASPIGQVISAPITFAEAARGWPRKGDVTLMN